MSKLKNPKSHADPATVLNGRRVVLAVTGGIAAYKSCQLARELIRVGAEVQVIMTNAATEFVTPLTFATLSGRKVHTETFPSDPPSDPVHLQPAAWGELLVVAPATANFIGKLTHGIADDLVSSVAMAFDKPLLIAPAMNPRMWENPAVQENVRTLGKQDRHFIGPESGEMGGVREEGGMGRMSEPEQIIQAIADILSAGLPLAGKKILVTSGPTREAIDPVRFVGNRSSGVMGDSIALQAAAMGADVTLIRGKGATAPTPSLKNIIPVDSAAEMMEAVKQNFGNCDALVMVAAVADWTIAKPAPGKLKKRDGAPELKWQETEDILAWAGKNRKNQVVVGFALETGNHESEARFKLEKKNVDLIVLNDPTKADSAFGGETTKLRILNAESVIEKFPVQSKRDAARMLLERIATKLETR